MHVAQIRQRHRPRKGSNSKNDQHSSPRQKSEMARCGAERDVTPHSPAAPGTPRAELDRLGDARPDSSRGRPDQLDTGPATCRSDRVRPAPAATAAAYATSPPAGGVGRPCQAVEHLSGERLQTRPDLVHLLRGHRPDKITAQTGSAGATHLTKYY